MTIMNVRLSTLLLTAAVPALSLGCLGGEPEDEFRYLTDGDRGRTTEGGGEEDDERPRRCTRTQGYWKNHNVYANNPNQQIPWPISEDTQLSGSTWLDILQTPPQGDAFYILAHQYIPAELNVASGASTPPEVDAALADADAYFADSTISAGEEQAALEASELLDAYNNGELSPGPCL